MKLDTQRRRAEYQLGAVHAPVNHLHPSQPARGGDLGAAPVGDHYQRRAPVAGVGAALDVAARLQRVHQ
jgi:hypothetical protein